jgi:hypothetical protein
MATIVTRPVHINLFMIASISSTGIGGEYYAFLKEHKML